MDARPLNLAEFLLRPGLAPDDAPALVTAHGVTTRGQLAEATRSASAWLVAQGVRPGQRVVLAMPDDVSWVAAFLATVRIGAVAALVASSVDADHARDLITRADPALVLTHRDDITPGLAAPVARPADLQQAIAAGLDDPGAYPTTAGDLCYLLATSGSTGPSKWVMHLHGHIPACIATFGRSTMRLGPGDVTWSVSALPTSYGLGNSLYFPLGAGAAAWLGGERDPESCVAACRAGGVTAVYGVPTFWARLARHCREGRVDPADLARIAHAGSAGENLPATVWTAVARDAGIRVCNGLGSSEATNLYLTDVAGGPRAGTVGWPVPGYDLCIEGQRALPGDEGELWVRGPTLFAGYLGNPAATAAAFTDGWFRSGDRVRMEADRSYTFLGRTGDVFKVGGLWVDPSRVQDLLLGDPDVADAVVVAVPDADSVNRLVAVVGSAAAPGNLQPRLMARLEQGLEHYMVPRAVVVATQLPVTPSGKVRRDVVMQMAGDALRGGGGA